MGKKVKEHPSFDRIQEALSYNRETGTFVWKIKTYGHQRIGDRAGRKLQGKFWAVGLDGCTLQVSRLVWLFETGEWPKARVMFKDGNPENTKFDNLQESLRLEAPDGDWNSARRQYRSGNPDYYKDKDLQKCFGISLEEYRAMHAAQNGLCAICGNAETSMRNGKFKNLAVDHCHTTGAVRSLLCSGCNPALGYMKDDPALLRKAADYLERHKGSTPKVIPLRIVKETN